MDEETKKGVDNKDFQQEDGRDNVSQDREDGVSMAIPDLRGKGMQVTEVVTHAHTGIEALMS